MFEKDKVHGLELELELVKKEIQKLHDELNHLNRRIDECFNRIEGMIKVGRGIAEKLTQI